MLIGQFKGTPPMIKHTSLLPAGTCDAFALTACTPHHLSSLFHNTWHRCFHAEIPVPLSHDIFVLPEPISVTKALSLYAGGKALFNASLPSCSAVTRLQ
jgi:hypothetical protein